MANCDIVNLVSTATLDIIEVPREPYSCSVDCTHSRLTFSHYKGAGAALGELHFETIKENGFKDENQQISRSLTSVLSLNGNRFTLFA